MFYVIGDIHGQYDKLVRLLIDAELVGPTLNWSGGTNRLWFIGDFFDRGARSLDAVALVMRLQQEAAAAGGAVGALLGNHEPLFLGAQRLGDAEAGGPGGTFKSAWLLNGGQLEDLENITAEQIAWLTSLPAMVLVEDTLLIHADALFYMRYGATIDAVNTAIQEILRGDNGPAWDNLLYNFSERMIFAQMNGEIQAHGFLAQYGGRRMIHGHTPIDYVRDCDAASVTEAFEYANGLCVNVDGGMYRGGLGFVYRAE